MAWVAVDKDGSRISLWEYINDKESRIKDFDKLIEIYSK